MENRKDKLRTYIEEERGKNAKDLRERKTVLSVETDLINDVVGPRRAGKTSLMKMEMRRLLEKTKRENVVYVNFENRRLFPLTPEYFNDLIQILHENESFKQGKVYLFLDEVQRIKNWEKYARSIYDEFKGKIKIFVSGSSSKLNEPALGNLLTGRHLTTVVFPLSFEEFLRFRGVDFEKPVTEEKEAIIKKALKEYLSTGGFPEVVLTRNADLIETLFLDVINRDVAPTVKNKEVLEEVAYFLCSNSGKLVSFSKLSNLLKARGVKISVPTLEKYFKLMKDCFLFFDVTIFSYKVKDQLQYPRKIYCIDAGFVNYFGFKFSEDAGRIMENCVAIELYKKSKQHAQVKTFYFKDAQQREVDFVVKEGAKITRLIQVCCDAEDVETKKREVKALLKASKELACKNLLVITSDYEANEKHGGKTIAFTPLWKWLLKP